MALILLNGCWESIATGALEQATYDLEKKNRSKRIIKLSGLDMEELDIWEIKMKTMDDCGKAIENEHAQAFEGEGSHPGRSPKG